MPSCRLRIEKICKSRLSSTGTPSVVLSDISLDVPTGEMTLLIGPSGGGKSTLLRLINRLEEADSGHIFLDDTDIRTLDVLELRRRVCLVTQKPFIFAGSVLDNLMAPFRLRREAAPDSEVFASILDLCRLSPSLVDRDARTLSGGEQQRVALARALSARPKIILADEPTGNLDSRTGAAVMDMLFDLRKRYGATLLLITHDDKLAKRCGRVLSMRDGKFEAPARARVKATA